jgi:hypothetical protein
MKAALIRPSRLPFRAPAVELLGYGTGATVFLLEGSAVPRVVKVYKRSIGRERSSLIRSARRYRGKYQQLAAWYGPLVLPCEFMVAHGPLLGRPAVVAVQPYVGGRFRDPLQTVPARELVRLLEADDELRAEFVAFARKTLEVHARGQFPDVFGLNNLVLLEDGGRMRLRLIDYGVFDLASHSARAVLPRAAGFASRLEALLHEVGDGSFAHS